MNRIARVATRMVAGLALPVLALAGCVGGGGGAGPGGGPPTMTAAQAIEKHAGSLMAMPGVTGVYEGRTPSGATVIRVMLEKPMPATEKQIPKRLEGYPVEIEISGRIEPMSR